MTESVSVVIPTHGASATLLRLLEALLPQLHTDDELVVALDRADEEVVRRLPARAILAKASTPGPAANRNAGWRAASNSLILFLDDDVLPSLNLIEAHRLCHHQGGQLFVGGRVVQPPLRGLLGDYLTRRGIVEQPVGSATYRHIYLSNASVRRAALEAVGGLDDDLLAREDADLALRLQNDGLTLHHLSDAIVTHQGFEGRISARAALRRAARAGGGTVRLLRKHPHLAEIEHRLLFHPWAAAGGAALAVILLPVAVAVRRPLPQFYDRVAAMLILAANAVGARSAQRRIRALRD